MSGTVPIRERAVPRLVGGNVAVCIDEDEYIQGLSEFINYLISILVLSKGDHPLFSNDRKAKLSVIWGLNNTVW